MTSTPVSVLAGFQTAPISQQGSSIAGSLLALIYGVGFLHFNCHNTPTSCHKKVPGQHVFSLCTVKACVAQTQVFCLFPLSFHYPYNATSLLSVQVSKGDVKAPRLLELSSHRRISHGLLQLQDFQELFLARSYLIPPLHTKSSRQKEKRAFQTHPHSLQSCT